MKIHRFYHSSLEKTDRITISDKELVHQMFNVLKLASGESVELFDGKGLSLVGKIESLSKKELVLMEEETKIVPDTRREIYAYIPLLRRTNTELVVQKLTELGIKHIIPIIADRSVKNDTNIERLGKIATEAVEQSGQHFLPQIHEPKKFKDALKEAIETHAFVFDMGGLPYRSIKHTLSTEGGSISFFIGPEGGWTDSERELVQTYTNIKVVSLGNTVLRAETACIIAGYESLT